MVKMQGNMTRFVGVRHRDAQVAGLLGEFQWAFAECLAWSGKLRQGPVRREQVRAIVAHSWQMQVDAMFTCGVTVEQRCKIRHANETLLVGSSVSIFSGAWGTRGKLTMNYCRLVRLGCGACNQHGFLNRMVTTLVAREN